VNITSRSTGQCSKVEGPFLVYVVWICESFVVVLLTAFNSVAWLHGDICCHWQWQGLMWPRVSGAWMLVLQSEDGDAFITRCQRIPRRRIFSLQIRVLLCDSIAFDDGDYPSSATACRQAVYSNLNSMSWVVNRHIISSTWCRWLMNHSHDQQTSTVVLRLRLNEKSRDRCPLLLVAAPLTIAPNRLALNDKRLRTRSGIAEGELAW